MKAKPLAQVIVLSWQLLERVRILGNLFFFFFLIILQDVPEAGSLLCKIAVSIFSLASVLEVV